MNRLCKKWPSVRGKPSTKINLSQSIPIKTISIIVFLSVAMLIHKSMGAHPSRRIASRSYSAHTSFGSMLISHSNLFARRKITTSNERDRKTWKTRKRNEMWGKTNRLTVWSIQFHLEFYWRNSFWKSSKRPNTSTTLDHHKFKMLRVHSIYLL